MNNMRVRAAAWLATGAISVFGCFGNANAGIVGPGEQDTQRRVNDLQVLGPVERTDIAHGVFLVAGQSIAIGKSTVFVNRGTVLRDASQAFQTIRPGDIVAVFGAIGKQPTLINRVNASYVPGSTRVVVQGRLSLVNASVGLAKIGGLTIDFTAAMSDTNFDGLSAGQIVRVAGIQPISGGQLLVDRVSKSSIIGTGAQPHSIIGTGAQPHSIIGTGAQSIIGTGAQSIIGTGAQPHSIIGTGAQSIIGTGAQPHSIIGTGAQSIIGTGAQPHSIIGTGAQSIIGTGAQPHSIIGTGAQSIIGTGAQPHSIIGTGAQSIIGTGAQPRSIIGTGAQSIIGTGAQPHSIIGTGAQSIIGTGAQPHSIIGTGAQSIIGTGASSH